MTCIVSFVADDKTIYIGGDSAGSNDYTVRNRSNPKVFINGEFIIGYTSSFRMGQILQFSLKPPKYIEELHGTIFQYMCTEFINSIRQCLTSGGYARVDAGEESGGDFIVGFKGKLFKIFSDYQVSENVENYEAAGCGEAYALGSLYASVKDEPEEIIKEALECAEYFSPFVRAPFTILKLENTK